MLSSVKEQSYIHAVWMRVGICVSGGRKKKARNLPGLFLPAPLRKRFSCIEMLVEPGDSLRPGCLPKGASISHGVLWNTFLFSENEGKSSYVSQSTSHIQNH